MPSLPWRIPDLTRSFRFRMSDPERVLTKSDLMRQVVVAWFVAVWVVAIGAFVFALHDPNTDDRLVPRVIGSPPAAEQPEDRVFVRNRSGWAPSRSGSSTGPETLPDAGQAP